MVLALMGLYDLPWNGDYVGSDLLSIVLLFFVTGIFASSNHKLFFKNVFKFYVLSTTILIKFIMNMLSFGIAIEKTLVTIYLIYQSATYSSYINGLITDQHTFIGQITLHSCQFLVIFLTFLNPIDNGPKINLIGNRKTFILIIIFSELSKYYLIL